MDVLAEIRDRLYDGDEEAIAALVKQALEQGLAADQILQDGLVQGMDRVGRDFRDGVLYVPEVLFCAKAMHGGVALLKPLLDTASAKNHGRIVIGSVKGDIHDIGKNLVAIMMEGAGFEVIDLGVDVSTEKFVEAVRKYQPDLVGMSSLLTTTMEQMKVVIAALEEAGVRDRVKVLVGGAPINARYAEEIGADAYAPNAGAAVTQGKALVAARSA